MMMLLLLLLPSFVAIAHAAEAGLACTDVAPDLRFDVGTKVFGSRAWYLRYGYDREAGDCDECISYISHGRHGHDGFPGSKHRTLVRNNRATGERVDMHFEGAHGAFNVTRSDGRRETWFAMAVTDTLLYFYYCIHDAGGLPLQLPRSGAIGLLTSPTIPLGPTDAKFLMFRSALIGIDADAQLCRLNSTSCRPRHESPAEEAW
jgi:hypothetical protein